MEITIGAKHIAALFGAGSTRITVPSFQRGYAWERKNITDFLSDITNSISDDDAHFYGPMVFLRPSKGDGPLDIIDGQQRMTTVVMFISLLRDAAFELEDRSFGGIHDLYAIFRNILFLPPMYTVPRFEANYQIRDFLLKYVVADPITGTQVRPAFTISGKNLDAPTKKSTKELRSAYGTLRDWIAEKSGERETEHEVKEFLYQAFVAATEHFEIHSMELYDEDQAFVLFETMNERGLQLDPSDLLKTMTLRKVKQHGDDFAFKAALKTWDKMTENLGGFDFTKFLRHFLLLEQEKKVQKTKIFGLFRQIIDEQGPHGATINLKRLEDASDLYGVLLGTTPHPIPEIRQSIERMSIISETHRILLLAIMRRLGSGNEPVQLFRAVESLAFRWVLVGKNAQEVETEFQTLGRDFAAGILESDELLERIDKLQPSDFELSSLLKSNKSAPLQKYVYRRIENLSGGQVVDGLTIEHLAPRNPSSHFDYWNQEVMGSLNLDQKNQFEYDDLVAMWGNLTLLEHALNSSIKNSPWNVKRDGDQALQYEGISASNLNLNQKIAKLDSWTGLHILDRTEWLVKAVIELVGRDWVDSGSCSIQPWSNF